MRLLVPSVITASVVLLGTAKAESDSLEDLMGPREMAVGEAMRGGATGAMSIGMNPAGLPLNRELVFEGGYGYRASDSASIIGVSACDSTNVVPGCFFYNYAGASPELDGMDASRTTHVVGSTLSRMLVPRIMVGATMKYYRISEDMDGGTASKGSGFTFDFGGTVRLTDIINIGISGQNLLATTEDEWYPRAVGGGVLARPLPMLALSFDSRWKTDGSGTRYGGGGEFFIRAGNYGIPLRIGGLNDTALDTTYVTGGIGIANIRWTIDIAARRAVSGPDETLVLASMRFFGPRLSAPTLDAM